MPEKMETMSLFLIVFELDFGLIEQRWNSSKWGSPEQWHREDKGKKMVFNWFLENASCCGVNDAVILGTQTPAAESPQLSTHTH